MFVCYMMADAEVCVFFLFFEFWFLLQNVLDFLTQCRLPCISVTCIRNSDELWARAFRMTKRGMYENVCEVDFLSDCLARHTFVKSRQVDPDLYSGWGSAEWRIRVFLWKSFPAVNFIRDSLARQLITAWRSVKYDKYGIRQVSTLATYTFYFTIAIK